MKQDINTLRGLTYNLRMIAIPISGPFYIYGDHLSIVQDTFKPKSVLRKKRNSVC